MQTKKVIIIVALISFNLDLFSQAPIKQWDARFGGSADDILYSLQQTSDGGYVLGGTSYSGLSGDKTQVSQGGSDYWIVKTDANGVKQWDVRLGGKKDDNLYSVQQTLDGGYILGGYTKSGIGADKTQASHGGIDYWIIKTDANGVKQWDICYGGYQDDYLYSLEQTSDSGFILGGISLSGISGDKTQTWKGLLDYWIVKVDMNGVKQWDASFGGTLDDILYSVRKTTDGGYILGGWSSSGLSGDKTQAGPGGIDYWIIKTDANGVKQWDASYGGTANDFFSCLQETNDGGYIFGGWSLSGIGGDKSQGNQGVTDYWIIKTNANGIKQWDARFGGIGGEELYSITQTTDDGYLLTGSSVSDINGDKTQVSQGFKDYWIAKTDSNGAKQWDADFGGSKDAIPNSLKQTIDGAYILGGYSKSGLTGDKTEPSQGGLDYWIVKTSPTVNTITTDIISGSPFCPEQIMNVPFSSTGSFNSGNFYTAELSDKFGLFTSPAVIGTLTSTVNLGSITSKIPSQPIAGTMYRIRVTSSDPEVTGTDNGSNLNLNACLKATGLSASVITSTSANVSWSAVACAAKYKVQYRQQGTLEWSSKHTTVNSYTITGLLPNTIYEIRVQSYCTSNGSSKSSYTPVYTFTTSLRLESGRPDSKQILCIYPNPAEGQTTIGYSLMRQSKVCVKVYDAGGREIETLVNDDLQVGDQLLELSTSDFAKGVYMVKMIYDLGIGTQMLVVQ